MSSISGLSGSVIAPIMFLEPELDETECSGTDKATIDYIAEHFDELKNVIRNCIKKSAVKGLYEEDVNDILIEVVEYFIKHSDYSVEKAYNPSNGNIVPIGGYVSKITQYCTIRYIHKVIKERKLIVFQTEGKSLYENIPDNSVASLFSMVEDSDIDSYLKELETIRYKYCSELDIYQFLYIKTIGIDLDTAQLDKMVSMFNISMREFNDICSRICKDVLIHDLMGAMVSDLVKSVQLLRRYVYGVDFIDEMAQAV